MIKNLLLSLIVSLTVTFCNDNSKEQQSEIASKINEAIPNSDTLIISEKSAIFYQPDSMQIEKRKKEVGEENFYIGIDDYAFYINSSFEFLDSIKQPVIEVVGKKVLKFIYSNKQTEVIKLDTLPELWGMYFFSPEKMPRLVDMTIIEEEYKNYFK